MKKSRNFIYAVKHILCFGNQQKYYTSATRATSKKKAHPLKFVIFGNFFFFNVKFMRKR